MAGCGADRPSSLPSAPDAVDERDGQVPVDGHLTGEPRVAEPRGETVVPVGRLGGVPEPDAAGGTQPAAAAVQPSRGRRVRRAVGVEEGTTEVRPGGH